MFLVVSIYIFNTLFNLNEIFMKKVMLRFSIVALVIAVFACQPVENETTVASADTVVAEKPTDGTFIHISKGYDNPHDVVMPLFLANKMAEDKDVILFFDLEGVNLLLNDSEDIMYEPFESAQTSLKSLMDKGVEVMACPMCLKAIGKGESDLMKGVIIAEKEKFFNFTDGRILTLDY